LEFIVSLLTPEDYGIAGDGTDQTAKFVTQIWSLGTRGMMAKEGSNYGVMGLKFPNGFKWENHYSGDGYTDDPRATHLNGAFVKIPSAPDNSCILDLDNQADPTVGKDVVLEGLAIDGMNGKVIGIKGGSNRLNIQRAFIRKCLYGLGGPGHYTTSATLRDFRAVLCGNPVSIGGVTTYGAGVGQLIDSRINFVLTSNWCGILLSDGSNMNTLEGRAEWNNACGIRMAGFTNPVVGNILTGIQIDANADAGLYMQKVQGGTISDMIIKRNGRGAGGEGKQSNIYMKDCSHLTMGIINTQHGVDDLGNPPDTPLYALERAGTNSQIIIGLSDLQGYTSAAVNDIAGVVNSGWKIRGVLGLADN
jgi:hypothetical protein